MSALVTLDNIEFAYNRQPVLCGITLDIEEGTTLGIIGPNGGGKTTLTKLLTGQLNPTAGRVRIGGLTPAEAVRRGDLVGYVPQKHSYAADFPITLRQLVRLGCAGRAGLLRQPPAEAIAFADGLLDRVGLADLANQPVSECSGGQLQRAVIARALAARPRLLLLDEPTTGIDMRGQRGFVELLQQLKADLRLTLIFVSHDMRAVTAISDRVACLNTHLHYHDTPHHLPANLVYDMFACDLQAMGIGEPHQTCAVHHPQ